MKKQQQKDYRDVLREEYADRCQRNPSYSLRAFARDLGIAPSRLCEVVNRKRGLSRQAAHKLAASLGYSPAETEVFILKVDATHARSPKLRQDAKARLAVKDQSSRNLEGALSDDIFKSIADWHHYALIELTTIKGFRNDPAWIAQRLGISVTQAELAMQRLLRLGLVVEDDQGLRPATDHTETLTDVPSAALRKHHEQILEKASKALKLQPIHERDFSALTIAINQTDVESVKTLIKQFQADINKFVDRANTKDRVYCLGVQFFALDHLS